MEMGKDIVKYASHGFRALKVNLKMVTFSEKRVLSLSFQLLGSSHFF